MARDKHSFRSELGSDWRRLILPGRRLRAELRDADQARTNGDLRLALEHYEKAIRLAPQRAGLWMQVGHARKETGDFGGAEDAYNRAAGLDASNADTDVQLGHLHKLMGNFKAAERHYQAAMDKGSSDEHAIHFLGEGAASRIEGGLLPPSLREADLARDAGMFEEAAILYRQAAEITPRGFIFVQLGNCLKEAGSLDAAAQAYGAALEVNPADADCMLQLGHLMKLMGQVERAELYYSESARVDPARPHAAFELAALRRKYPNLQPERIEYMEKKNHRPEIRIILRPTEVLLARIAVAQMRRRA